MKYGKLSRATFRKQNTTKQTNKKQKKENRKVLGPDYFKGKFHQTLKKSIIPTLLTYCKITEKEKNGQLLNSFLCS